MTGAPVLIDVCCGDASMEVASSCCSPGSDDGSCEEEDCETAVVVETVESDGVLKTELKQQDVGVCVVLVAIRTSSKMFVSPRASSTNGKTNASPPDFPSQEYLSTFRL